MQFTDLSLRCSGYHESSVIQKFPLKLPAPKLPTLPEGDASQILQQYDTIGNYCYFSYIFRIKTIIILVSGEVHPEIL
jgi:hypothetical protein